MRRFCVTVGTGIEATGALLPRSPRNVDRPHETIAVHWRASVRAHPGRVRLEFHMHMRTGSPSGQNDAVQQGRARCPVCATPDERGEDMVPVEIVDLIDSLQLANARSSAPGSRSVLLEALPRRRCPKYRLR